MRNFDTLSEREMLALAISLEEDDASSEFFYGRVHNSQVEIDQKQAARLMTRHAQTVQGCSYCYLQHTCAGGCPIKAYQLTGDFYGKDWYTCEMRRLVSGTLVQKIIDQELTPR